MVSLTVLLPYVLVNKHALNALAQPLLIVTLILSLTGRKNTVEHKFIG